MLANLIIITCLLLAFGGLWTIGRICGGPERDELDDAIARYLKHRRRP